MVNVMVNGASSSQPHDNGGSWELDADDLREIAAEQAEARFLVEATPDILRRADQILQEVDEALAL